MNNSPSGIKQSIWKLANITRQQFRDMPWPEKKRLILKYGELSDGLTEKTDRLMKTIKWGIKNK